MSSSVLIKSMEEEYLSVSRFVEENDGISYPELDFATTERVNLFTIPEEERFFDMEKRLDKIISSLGALKRIFSKPITRLKDVRTVLPVEAVRVINNSTMRHISYHTELWGNITDGGLKPRKLMTLTHEDQYKIYENIAFARLVGYILSYVRQSMELLRDVIYSCQPMHFNLLERTNHLMYFLALGKLHVGYAHAKDNYRDLHARCFEKLVFIDKTLRSRLGCTVYRVCKKDKSKLTLKRTNIFRLQKDYKQVYSLLKLFGEESILTQSDCFEEALSQRAYADYGTLLALFSAGHFNFRFKESSPLHFRKLKANASFKDWKLKIERYSTQKTELLSFSVTKEKSYCICVVFGDDKKSDSLEKYLEKHKADEVIYAQRGECGREGEIYLNLFCVDSFRRIQQLILRAMVYADEKRETCPFCGAPLARNKDDSYECGWCKSLIKDELCPESGKSYFTLTLKDYKIHAKESEEKRQSPIDKAREREGVLFFRNITRLSPKNKPLCPHCGKEHN